jgi:hypothetical protein
LFIYGVMWCYYMLNVDEIYRMKQDEVIEILQEHGIQVVMKPVALMPDNLESYHGIGRQSLSIIETDIYEALMKLNIRMSVMPDPFS